MASNEGRVKEVSEERWACGDDHNCTGGQHMEAGTHVVG